MHFVLTFNQPADVIELQEHPTDGPPTLVAWRQYMDEMAAAGVMRGGQRLSPPWTATTVRVRDGQRLIQDGPFADTKELAAGFVVIDVPSIDEALRWAEKAPSSRTGSTEVRPVAVPPAS